jgi:hypothetical protein
MLGSRSVNANHRGVVLTMQNLVGSRSQRCSKPPGSASKRKRTNNILILTNWTKCDILSNMRATVDTLSKEAALLDDETKDKKVVFHLLSKFNLSAGEVAEIFAVYLLRHPAKEEDLERLRSALRAGANDAQAQLVQAAEGVLSSEEVTKLLGYGSRQSTNNKKRNGELLAVSFLNRRGDYFPRCQFDGAQVKPWIPELLKRLPNGWSALAFLTARSEDLGGRSWLEVLREAPSKATELLIAADAYVS